MNDGEAATLRARVVDAVLDGAADAVIACDRAGIIRLWSAGAERIFGYPSAEALGRSLDIIIPERLQARHWDGYHHMMKTGQSRYPLGHLLSAPGRRKDGSQVSIEFTVVSLKDAHGEVTDLVAVLRDVTPRFEEMKALRRQVRENAGQGGANVS